MYSSKIMQLFASTIFFFGRQHDFQKDPYWLFDTKTAYTVVRGKDLNIPKDCEIQQIFALIRHGTRDASSDDVEGMKKLMPFKEGLGKKAHLKEKDIRAIQDWEIGANDKINKDLNGQGITDMNDLSSRVKEAFGDIFNETFNPNIHKVLTSKETRARQSGLHFLKNAFGNKIQFTSINDLPIFDEDDVALNVDKLKTDGLPIGDKENNFRSFQEGPKMQEVLKRIAKRIGLRSPITYDQGKAMYDSCRYDKAIYTNTTPAWCRVFTKQELQVFEYLNDMSFYYKFGWGNELGRRLGCPLLTRLNFSFKQAAKHEGARGVFYFGHSSNQFVAITMLGLGRDLVPLRADNMDQMAERKWKTSRLNPFAANTIAAFYKCKDDVDRVSFFVNENIMPIELDGKSTCTVCPWKKVENKFDRITADKTICGFGYTITPP